MHCCLSHHNSHQHKFTKAYVLLFPALARTALQKAYMRTSQYSCAKSPIQKGTNSQKAHRHCCLFRHNSRQHGLPESLVLLPAPARTALQKAYMRTRQHNLTESPILTRTDSQKSLRAVLLVSPQLPPARPPESPLLLPAPARTTRSPDGNPPAQPHRQPNPERDRLTENPHAVLLSNLPGPL